jgi:NAD(P)-dependent dehydrogenase (short-subunit alcohol dehydrogenase family)
MEWYYYTPILLILYKLLRYYFNGPKTNLSKDMSGKVIIITGSSAGVGRETATQLLEKGAEVIFACRDEKKTQAIISQLKNREKANFIQLNLASFKSVFNFVQQFKQNFDHLDVLINNAGIVNIKYNKTIDGIEETFQTNHLAHTLLTGLLLNSLTKSSDTRVINIGSNIHQIAKMDENTLSEAGFSTFGNYALSKVSNNFLTRAINRLNINVKAVTVHPGAVLTDISKLENKPMWIRVLYFIFVYPISRIGFKDSLMGAQTTLHCCYLDRETLVGNGYYSDCKITKEGATINPDFEKFVAGLTQKYLSNLENMSDLLEEDFKTSRNLCRAFGELEHY